MDVFAGTMKKSGDQEKRLSMVPYTCVTSKQVESIDTMHRFGQLGRRYEIEVFLDPGLAFICNSGPSFLGCRR